MLKFLLIALLILVFVPPVRRFLFYLLVGRQMVKEQKRQHEAQRNRQSARPNDAKVGQSRPGQTKVDFIPPGATKPRTKGGDYVDYEEIK